VIWVERNFDIQTFIRAEVVTYHFVFVIWSLQMPQLYGFSEWRSDQELTRKCDQKMHKIMILSGHLDIFD
jgi:hypothetical protein